MLYHKHPEDIDKEKTEKVCSIEFVEKMTVRVNCKHLPGKIIWLHWNMEKWDAMIVSQFSADNLQKLDIHASFEQN